uniref:Ig-like domain-containing protein n=1 Tax=Electrophorus electricus TaxID=8005 RepID=A0AAY5EHT9_ELEEL
MCFSCFSFSVSVSGVSTDNWRYWSVTYYSQKICSLIGSSVDLHCYYTYPNNQKVTKSFWFITEQQVGVEPVDVREEEEYEGRVQYRQSFQNDCSMTVTHLRESDAHTYRFRFHTDSTAGKYTGHPGVSLSVTDLKITVSDRSSRKHLICSSTCTLPNNPTYIWYRNGQPVYNQNTNGLYVYGSSEDAGSYSCSFQVFKVFLESFFFFYMFFHKSLRLIFKSTVFMFTYILLAVGSFNQPLLFLEKKRKKSNICKATLSLRKVLYKCN